jgi:hypothetical protein
VSFFVLSPKIEDRDEVEVATGRITKKNRTSYYYENIFDLAALPLAPFPGKLQCVLLCFNSLA